MNEHVLVVDDDPEIRDSLRRGLTVEGYSVSLAEDGAEALSVARDRAPDLVVLDVMLPELDGLEVCRRFRMAEASLPIVLLTARDAVPDRVAGQGQPLTGPRRAPGAFLDRSERWVTLRRLPW